MSRKTLSILATLPASAMGLALCVQISSLSWILQSQYGLGLTQVGWVWAGGPLAGLAGQFAVGKISDSSWFWGARRRPFILVGGMGSALMLLLVSHLKTLSIALDCSLLTLSIAVAFLLNLFLNIGFGPARALVADLSAEGATRTQAFTLLQTISGAIGVLAYFAGGAFGNSILLNLGAACVLMLSFSSFFIKEPRFLERIHSTQIPEHENSRLEQIQFALANGLSWFGIQVVFVFAAAFLSSSVGAYGFAVLNCVGFIAPYTLIRLCSDRLGRKKTMAVSLGLMALAFLACAALAHNPILFLFAMAFAGVGWGAMQSLPMAVFSEQKGAGAGVRMAWFNLTIVIPQLAVSLFVGNCLENWGDPRAVFWIAASSIALAAVFWII